MSAALAIVSAIAIAFSVGLVLIAGIHAIYTERQSIGLLFLVISLLAIAGLMQRSMT